MSKMKGVKCKIEVVDSADLDKVLAGQRDGTLNRSSATLDATSKDSDDWQEYETGKREWGVDTGGLLIANDAAYDYLEDKWFAGENVTVKVTLPSGKKYTGNAVITDFPIDMPYEDLVSYSVSFSGNGKLEKTPASAE